MSRLLQTRLPVAAGGSVDSATFNRLVRILEINLGAVDLDNTRQINSDEVASLQFATGAIIFNTTLEIHQAFDGVALRDLYGHQTYVLNSSGITSAVGALTVSI